jgi:hypothetical protein
VGGNENTTSPEFCLRKLSRRGVDGNRRICFPLVNIPGTAAKLPEMKGTAVDPAGNIVFAAGGNFSYLVPHFVNTVSYRKPLADARGSVPEPRP